MKLEVTVIAKQAEDIIIYALAIYIQEETYTRHECSVPQAIHVHLLPDSVRLFQQICVVP